MVKGLIIIKEVRDHGIFRNDTFNHCTRLTQYL